VCGIKRRSIASIAERGAYYPGFAQLPLDSRFDSCVAGGRLRDVPSESVQLDTQAARCGCFWRELQCKPMGLHMFAGGPRLTVTKDKT
jgi:hypothetical protein